MTYDTIEEFTVDWKVECGQFNLEHVSLTNIEKYIKIRESSPNE